MPFCNVCVRAYRIVKEEGVGGLFTGAGPTVVRAMALNMGMLASNDQVCCNVLPLHVWHRSPGISADVDVQGLSFTILS